MSGSDRRSFDVLVLGGGTAGCAVAARLSEDPSRDVCLVEAGPDYGPVGGGRWPADLVDARRLALSHDWGYGGGRSSLRARVLGGCAAHNACVALAGAPEDYDEWRAAGWSFERLQPYLRRAAATLGVRHFDDEELAPWHRAVLAAGAEAGFPVLATADHPEAPIGVAAFPVNARGWVRWSTAFAYVDPARDRPNLAILGDALVDRVEMQGDRVAAAVVRHAGEERRLQAGMVVLCAGAYGSPAILLRSGIGPAADLAALGIPVGLDLPGVGANLADHAGTGLEWTPSERLEEETAAFEERQGLFEAQTVVKTASSACAPGTWDLHLLPWVNPRRDDAGRRTGGYQVTMAVFAMKPGSRGSVRLHSADPSASPRIDHGFLSDAADGDVVVEGIAVARRLAATGALAAYAGGEIRPGPNADIRRYGAETVRGYFHPVGTCRMGPAGDPTAVVDGAGRVHGLANLAVVDASVMPTIPRTNTNLTVLALAEGLAEGLAATGRPAPARR
jgi:choline dehydrogenase